MTKKYNIIRSVPRGENVVASDVSAKKRVGFRAAFAYVSDFTFGRKCMACCQLLLVLLVCLWYGIALLPLPPQAEIQRRMLVHICQNEEQIIRDVQSYQMGRPAREPDYGMMASELWGGRRVVKEIVNSASEPGVCEILAMGRELLLLRWVQSRVDRVFCGVGNSEENTVEPEIFNKLMSDTNAFFGKLATSSDGSAYYDDCAALAVRWKILISTAPRPLLDELAKRQPMEEMLSAARPLVEKYLEKPARDSVWTAVVRILPPLQYACSEVLKSNPARMAELLNNMERAENHLLELVLGVKDAATAEAAEQSILEALQRCSEVYERVRPVQGAISAPIETPERRKTADALEKRLQELRNLPQPFYGNKTLKRVLTWG